MNTVTYRVQAVKLNLKLNSRPGGGTILTVRIRRLTRDRLTIIGSANSDFLLGYPGTVCVKA